MPGRILRACLLLVYVAIAIYMVVALTQAIADVDIVHFFYQIPDPDSSS